MTIGDQESWLMPSAHYSVETIPSPILSQYKGVTAAASTARIGIVSGSPNVGCTVWTTLTAAAPRAAPRSSRKPRTEETKPTLCEKLAMNIAFVIVRNTPNPAEYTEVPLIDRGLPQSLSACRILDTVDRGCSAPLVDAGRRKLPR